jgi:hypothetical protein
MFRAYIWTSSGVQVVSTTCSSYNLYSCRCSYVCSKHVELIYENKLHMLHQVGSCRHCSIRCTVTHTHIKLFSSLLPGVRNNNVPFEGSQTPSACLSGKTAVLQWRWVRSIGGMLPVGDIRSVGKLKFSEKKFVAIPLWSLHNSHGLARYWTRALVVCVCVYMYIHIHTYI